MIDLIVHSEKERTVTLVMVENRRWDSSEEQLFQLQEKLNAYLSFALDGEMEEVYPQLIGLPLRLKLECVMYPTDEVIDLLQKVREQIAFQGIDLEVVVKEATPPAA